MRDFRFAVVVDARFAGARVRLLAARVFFAAAPLFATLLRFAVVRLAVVRLAVARFGAAFLAPAVRERVFVDAPDFDAVRRFVFVLFAAMATSWSIHLNVSTGMQVFNG